MYFMNTAMFLRFITEEHLQSTNVFRTFVDFPNWKFYGACEIKLMFSNVHRFSNIII